MNETRHRLDAHDVGPRAPCRTRDLHAPPVRGEEYVRQLIHAMIHAYGPFIVFDMFERGIKVKPRLVVVF